LKVNKINGISYSISTGCCKMIIAITPYQPSATILLLLEDKFSPYISFVSPRKHSHGLVYSVTLYIITCKYSPFLTFIRMQHAQRRIPSRLPCCHVECYHFEWSRGRSRPMRQSRYCRYTYHPRMYAKLCRASNLCSGLFSWCEEDTKEWRKRRSRRSTLPSIVPREFWFITPGQLHPLREQSQRRQVAVIAVIVVFITIITTTTIIIIVIGQVQGTETRVRIDVGTLHTHSTRQSSSGSATRVAPWWIESIDEYFHVCLLW